MRAPRFGRTATPSTRCCCCCCGWTRARCRQPLDTPDVALPPNMFDHTISVCTHHTGRTLQACATFRYSIRSTRPQQHGPSACWLCQPTHDVEPSKRCLACSRRSVPLRCTAACTTSTDLLLRLSWCTPHCIMGVSAGSLAAAHAQGRGVNSCTKHASGQCAQQQQHVALAFARARPRARSVSSPRARVTARMPGRRRWYSASLQGHTYTHTNHPHPHHHNVCLPVVYT
jgi:hypothetical protein